MPLSHVMDLSHDLPVQPGTLFLQPFHTAAPESPSHLLCAEVHALVHGHVRHGGRHGQGQGEVVRPAEAASEDCASIWRARGRGRRQTEAGRTTFCRKHFTLKPREGKSLAQGHTVNEMEANELAESTFSSILACLPCLASSFSLTPRPYSGGERCLED